MIMPEKDILYHYCSNSAFHSIITNKAIRLSSLSLGNDYMEGKLVSELIVEMAEEDSLAPEETQRLKESVSDFESYIDGLGFCLSGREDLLSQWRGYADDASGVSIGFSKNYLRQLSTTCFNTKKADFHLEKVVYEKEAQKKLINLAYTGIKKALNKIPHIGTSKATEFILYPNKALFWNKLFLLKTKAFHEEREWRFVSLFFKNWKAPCSFRPLDDKIIPYRELELKRLVKYPDRIVKVYLGPKNKTPKYVIELFLEKNGFKNVEVVRSSASYR